MNLNKDITYYQNTRIELLQLLPKDTILNRVLDVGCGNGNTASILKQEHDAVQVVGVEINENLKPEAEENLDEVIIDDVEKIELPFDEEYFDLIIFADVLEHLYDPWFVLKKLKIFLKSDGFVLASIPNTQHWSVLFNLALGKWEYKNEGLLDNTHVRFFTRRTMERMFSDAGFEIKKMNRSMGKIIRFLNMISFFLFNDILSFRYFVLARKK